MKAGDLKFLLNQYPDDQEVYFEHAAMGGDGSKTVVVTIDHLERVEKMPERLLNKHFALYPCLVLMSNRTKTIHEKP